MTNNWQTRAITDFSKVLSGSTPKTSEPTYWNGEIGWVTPYDLSKLKYKYVERGERNITEVGLKRCSAELVPANSLIMSSRAPIGYFAINTKPVATNQGCKSFVTDDSVAVEFLYYALNQYIDSIKRLGSGSTFAEVGKKQLESLFIQIPPKQLQQKIADILSSLDEAIQKTDQIIQKTEELKKGTMQELLTKGIGHKKFKKTKIGEIPEEFEIVNLGQFAVHVGSGITPRGGSSVYKTEGIPFIRSQNVYPDGLRLEDVTYITNQTHKLMQRSVVRPEDVLLNITGASIGRCAIVPINFLEANVNQHVCIIRTDKKMLSPYFLHYFLQSRFGQQQIMSLQIGGNRQGLNYEQIRRIQIPLVEITEQHEICEILSKIDFKLIEEKKTLSKFKFLKKGLMQDIFSQKVQIN